MNQAMPSTALDGGSPPGRAKQLRHAMTWVVAGLLLSPYIAAPLTLLVDDQVDRLWGVVAFASAAAALVARWHWPSRMALTPPVLFATAYCLMFGWAFLWLAGFDAWRFALVTAVISVVLLIIQTARGRVGHWCHLAAVVTVWGLAFLGLFAYLIGLLLVPVAVGLTISVRQPRGPRSRRPWKPVPPNGLRRVRIAGQILTYTQAPVAILLGMFVAALLGTWFQGFVVFIAPPLALTGGLFVRAASRVREPHLGWRWYDLALAVAVLGAGTYLWLFGFWRARGDVDPAKAFWFCVAALWLLAVAAAGVMILSSWRQPSRSCTTSIHNCVHSPRDSTSIRSSLPWNRRPNSLALTEGLRRPAP